MTRRAVDGGPVPAPTVQAADADAAPTVPTTPARLPSLRAAMLWRVLLPLALTWLLGSGIAVTVAYVYTQKAFDRSLLDDAYAIAANVGQRDGDVSFGLSPREVGAVLFDQEERAYFAVLRPDGTLVAGQGGLLNGLAQPRGGLEAASFDDFHFRGVDVRRVVLRRQQPAPYAVVVAETTRSRTQLAGQLLAAAVAPQALLLLALGLWLRRSIAAQLQPLALLEQALEQRDSKDLTPVHLAPRSRDIALLADAFNALMERIGVGARAQREFVGNVAHEMRTPLAGIRSLAEYGLAQQDAQAWRRQLGHIVSSEQRASHLVDQLLALALADEAQQSLQLQPVALDALVQDLLLRLLPRADALGVDLGADGIDQPLWVLGSAALLEGLLVNLTDNALRYGRPLDATQTPRVTVAVEAVATPGQAAADALLLSVADNGPGMDAAQRSRVLARWEQGPLGRQHGEGAGLGLAIVARYVELLNGRMALEPAVDGSGLRVCVWLRRVDAPGAISGPTQADCGAAT